MNRAAVVLLACALPLASCDNSPEVHAENATAGEVADKMAKAGGTESFVNPGKWESKVTFEEMTMPGMPKEVAAQMKGFAGRVETQQSCLTPEEAKKPKEDFFAGENKNCRYERFDMGGGRINAVMKCAEEGMTHTMTMQGNYTPDTYNMRMAMTAEGGPGPSAGMSMKMSVDARRIGQCAAGES